MFSTTQARLEEPRFRKDVSLSGLGFGFSGQYHGQSKELVPQNVQTSVLRLFRKLEGLIKGELTTGAPDDVLRCGGLDKLEAVTEGVAMANEGVNID